MSRLKDKVVLVTGAAQGTGEATARLASSEGARVVVTDIQSEKAAVVAKSLGDSAIACELDVTSEESWALALPKHTSTFIKYYWSTSHIKHKRTRSKKEYPSYI